MEPVLLAADSSNLFVSDGQVPFRPDATLSEGLEPDLVCIPDLYLPPSKTLRNRYPVECAWLRDRFEGGAVIASACSGTFLLAESGLLDGLNATIHWAYAENLQAAYPQIRVHREQVLVVSGPEQRIITCGGGISWQDMVLYLVARFFGQEEARNLSRLYLLNWHDHGQLPFAAASRPRQMEDRTIADVQVWLSSHYSEPGIIQAMADKSGLKERSFKRRFRKATGMSPIEYVHTLRVEEAKHMLESDSQRIEMIALELGYEDASFFRRLFRRRVGMTPSEYRKRFMGIRRSLQRAEDPLS
ncbi:GlxA family transcriptional regulator [Microbulbifer taiwanensis]|uniref:GlxA family transcriptional regulator n=1 Tax=Microbulbifer taiwanensis TaxID=986746 RepID=A0ABW1YRD9_9GAMM|nr:helix-turn-helix domain-containing protein [Microbulbifer taiwanensis]